MIIEKGTSAEKVAFYFKSMHVGRSLLVLGSISNAIVIEQLTIEAPEDGLSPAQIADDANWQQKTSGEILWQFDADNIDLVVDSVMGWVRFNKPAGDDNGLELSV